MGKKIIVQLASPERYFTKCYHDFMDCKLLNGEEKIVFLALKRFLDVKSDNGDVFPTIETIQEMTGWGNQKVVKYIKSLAKKGVVKKIRQGLNKPNIYILLDYTSIWACDNIEDMAIAVQSNDAELLMPAKHIAELEYLGYKVKITEKRLDAEPTKAQSQAPNNTNFPLDKNTTAKPNCQAERYTIEQIKQLFDYNTMIHDNPYQRQDIDSVMDIFYTAMNTAKSTIRIAGEPKPTMVVISKLVRLSYSEIIYAIEKFKAQTKRIKNPTNYMLTLLYNSKEQMNLDISNQISHEMAQ